MATLTIRSLPDVVHDALRLRAAEHRHSMEAEARALLTAALQPADPVLSSEQLRAAFEEMARPIKARQPAGWSGVDAYLAERRLEGAWEDGRVTNEERKAWLESLERFEREPSDLEAFLASRTPRP